MFNVLDVGVAMVNLILLSINPIIFSYLVVLENVQIIAT